MALSSRAAQERGSQGKLNTCFNSILHPFFQLQTANTDTSQERFAGCQFSWLLCKSHNHWHFSYVTNPFCFVCLFVFKVSNISGDEKCNLKGERKISRVDVNKPRLFNFSILFFKPVSGFLVTLSDYCFHRRLARQCSLVSQHSQQHITLLHLFQMFGGKQIKPSCLLTISVHSEPRKACDLLNSLQEVFSSTFDTEGTEHPVCTRSCLFNRNNS